MKRGRLAIVSPMYGTFSNKSIQDLLATKTVDGYFLALPNLPNTFMADVTKQFIVSGWQGVLVDALKRSNAVEQLLKLRINSSWNHLLDRMWVHSWFTHRRRNHSCLKLCLHHVQISFGVGIVNWEAYYI